LAKNVHKRQATRESKELLVDAYFARIEDLIEKRSVVDAKALMDLVENRYPFARKRLRELEVKMAVRTGSVDELVRPLLDSDTPPEKRKSIENVIKTEVTDLDTIAKCEALPLEHPLREGAAALSAAFTAVTSGPVEDEQIALASVSRRSPLAPWKMLVRAIAYFHRRDDEACEKCLGAIDPDSVPARLVPGLRAMLGQEDAAAELGATTAKLVTSVAGNVAALRDSLAALDGALRKKNHQAMLRHIRNATVECRQSCPDLLDRLKQHISIRCVLRDVSAENVIEAMGGPSLKTAYFWRLFARAAEVEDEGQLPRAFQAASLWERFRRHAIQEGWFAAKSPQEAAVYLHMAAAVRAMPEDYLVAARRMFRTSFEGYLHYYEGQPASVRAAAPRSAAEDRDAFFLYPEQLYERACAASPAPEIFQQWLAWVKEQNSHWRPADEVAQAWHQAFPEDSRPLLYLMDSAEKRNALKKALGYLEQAEKLDRLSTDVRAARLRLLVATAKRHLKQKKRHLAEKDLGELAALPEAQSGDRPAFLSALRWVGAAAAQDIEEANAHNLEVRQLLGGELAATVVLSGLAEACGLRKAETLYFLPPAPAQSEPGDMAAAAARACVLGDDMGTPFDIPVAWESRLAEELAAENCSLDTQELRALAETASRGRRMELAYAASGAGLAKEGADRARFLLLRAGSLPTWAYGRREKCAKAAASLARRRRDMDLVKEAIDLLRGPSRRWFAFSPWGDDIGEEDLSMDAVDVERVLQRELDEDEFPTFDTYSFRDEDEDEYDDDEYDDDDDDDASDFGQCNCPSCRRARGELVVDDYEDEDDDWDYDEDEDELGGFPFPSPGSIPSELVPLVLEMALKMGEADGSLPDLDEVRRKDPELLERVIRTFLESQAGGGDFEDFDELDSTPAPDTRRTARKQRKRRKKRRR